MGQIRINQGDDVELVMTFVDSDGDAVAITGGTIKLKISESLSDSNTDADFYDGDVTITDGATGVATANITDADTKAMGVGSYYFQGRYIASDGKIYSSKVDVLIIEPALLDDEA